jgi:hypothetical protein
MTRGTDVVAFLTARVAAGGHDHVDLLGDQLADEGRKALILSFRPSILDQNVSALDLPEVTQPITERPDEIGLEGLRGVPEEPYPVLHPRLLGLGSDRPQKDAYGDSEGQSQGTRLPRHEASPFPFSCASNAQDQPAEGPSAESWSSTPRHTSPTNHSMT